MSREPTPSNEAFWWSLFSAGGVMSALFLPAIVLVTGLLLPYQTREKGVGAYDHVYGIVSFWPVRIVLFAVMALSFVHAAHRIRHIVIDVGWRHATAPLSIVIYGAGFAGAAASGYVLWML